MKKYENIDEIKSAFMDTPPKCQSYLIRGVRVSGKTVLMTSIAKELCEKAAMTAQFFSKYRERLINKGLIQAAGHGYVEHALPRFGEICNLYV